MTNHLEIEIKGKDPDYFLRELIRNEINIYHLDKEPSKMRVIIHQKDYEKLVKIKTTYKIKIIKRYGINKYQNWLKNYWYVFLFILMGLGINLVLSHMIFEIEIIHPNQELVKEVRKDLEELGIKKYTFKVGYQKREKIKEQILEKEKENIEWLEIEEEGTKYKVTVEERKKNKDEKECNPRNIVSKKNAILLEIDASSGEIVKKKNDYVEKNEVVISGVIHNKEEIVSTKCAIGEIYGETWYRMKINLPKEEIRENLLSDKEKGFFIQVFDWYFGKQTKFPVFLKKEYNIIEGKILPIKLGFIEYQEKEIKIRKYSEKELEDKALLLAQEEMMKRRQQNEEILLKKVLKMYEKDSRIEVEVFLKVKENITDYLDIGIEKEMEGEE